MFNRHRCRGVMAKAMKACPCLPGRGVTARACPCLPGRGVMAKACPCLPGRLVTMLVVIGTCFVVEGFVLFMIVNDIVTCEHVVCFLLGLVVCAGIFSWILLWTKRVERLRNARRKEYLLKDRPPARQHRVHPCAFEPAVVVDTQPLTYKQLFEPDQLLKTLLPRRQVALCEVHQYNTESRISVTEYHKEHALSLQRSRSLPLLSVNDSTCHSNYNKYIDNDDYSEDGRWHSK